MEKKTEYADNSADNNADNSAADGVRTTLADCVLEDEREGRITIAAFDGFHTFDFEAFMKQPVEGLLYDLNMDKATLLTMLGQENQQEAVEWVNRYAAMRVIERLMKRKGE